METETPVGWTESARELQGHKKEKCKSSTQTVYSKTRGSETAAKVCTAYRNAARGPRHTKQRQHSQWLSLPSATTSAHH